MPLSYLIIKLSSFEQYRLSINPESRHQRSHKIYLGCRCRHWSEPYNILCDHAHNVKKELDRTYKYAKNNYVLVYFATRETCAIPHTTDNGS